LENNANINQARKDGSSPLYISCQEGYLEIVNLLFNAGAEIDQTEEAGYTPLFVACEKGHIEIVKELLRMRANFKLTNKYGETPLHFSCNKGQTDIVQLLKAKEKEEKAKRAQAPLRRTNSSIFTQWIVNSVNLVRKSLSAPNIEVVSLITSKKEPEEIKIVSPEETERTEPNSVRNNRTAPPVPPNPNPDHYFSSNTKEEYSILHPRIQESPDTNFGLLTPLAPVVILRSHENLLSFADSIKLAYGEEFDEINFLSNLSYGNNIYENLPEKEKSYNLEKDEVISIYFYTSEWTPTNLNLYSRLNRDLSSSQRDRSVPKWKHYLHYLFFGSKKNPQSRIKARSLSRN